MYLTLKIGLPSFRGRLLTGEYQRKLFSQAFAGETIDGRFLGRNSDLSLRQERVLASGANAGHQDYGAAPDVRFQTSEAALCMHAFGTEAMGLLLGIIPDLTERLKTRHGGALPATIATGKLGLIAADNLIIYKASTIILRRLRQGGKHVNGTEYAFADVKDGVKRAVANGVVSRAVGMSRYDTSLEDALPANLENEILPLDGHVFLRQPGEPGSKSPLCVCAAKVTFAMPYLLSGPWEAGAYRNYGYGSFTVDPAVRSRTPMKSLELAA